MAVTEYTPAPERDFTQFRSNYLGRSIAWADIPSLDENEFMVLWAEARTFLARVEAGAEQEGTLSRLYAMADQLCQLSHAS